MKLIEGNMKHQFQLQRLACLAFAMQHKSGLVEKACKAESVALGQLVFLYVAQLGIHF